MCTFGDGRDVPYARAPAQPKMAIWKRKQSKVVYSDNGKLNPFVNYQGQVIFATKQNEHPFENGELNRPAKRNDIAAKRTSKRTGMTRCRLLTDIRHSTHLTQPLVVVVVSVEF